MAGLRDPDCCAHRQDSSECRLTPDLRAYLSIPEPRLEMIMRFLLTPIVVTATLVSVAPTAARAQADHQHHGDAATVGRVSFLTSCQPAVQERFEKAVAMLHSFWFEEAQKSFEQVAVADPSCAMAHWGIAMTQLGNPFTGVAPTPERQKVALAAGEQAVTLAASVSPRERGYAAAALALYRDADKTDYRSRMRAHEAAMRAVYEQNPSDPEAAAFYARSVISNAPPADLKFERQRYAATLLEPLFLEQPKHPGLAHYIIHTFDSPALAQNGLDAARRYAGIAPSAPHALHMPSHIFTRLGYWDESIATNQRSAAAEPNPDAAVHAMDYMLYAYLQQGRDKEAQGVRDRAVALPDRFYSGILGYNFAAMSSRYALEREAWADAATLAVPTGTAPFIEAVPRFARAIGAARSRQPEVAAPEVTGLAALRDTLKQRNDTYWATIVESQRLAAESWLAHARGNDADAVRLASEAATLEETVEKHPVTPGPLLPARELEGDLLLELKRPADALRAYEQVLLREPNRRRALFGAARAGQAAGNSAAARKHYAALLELLAKADGERAETKAAKAYLKRG